MKNKKNTHPAACPCSKCGQNIKDSTESDGSKFDLSEISRLRQLKPETARVLGFTHLRDAS